MIKWEAERPCPAGFGQAESGPNPVAEVANWLDITLVVQYNTPQSTILDYSTLPPVPLT